MMEKKSEIKKATKTAIVCYGLGDLASQFIWTYISSYLTIFYTDVVGFTPVIVSMILLIARVWDAVNDPIMGAIAERTKSRFGRFRPWILFCSPWLCIALILAFVNVGKGPAGITYSLIMYIIAGMLYTAVNITYSSLPAVMTEDSNQRNLLGVSRSIGMNLGMIIVNSCSAGLALFFSGSGSQVADGKGYLAVAVIYGVISIPLLLIVFFSSKELIIPHTGTTVSAKETFKNVIHNKYLMVICLIYFIQMMAFMGRISITAYYVIYCLGAYTLVALIMTIPCIGGVIGSCFIAKVAAKLGKRNALALTFIGQAAGLIVIYTADFSNLKQIIIGHCIYGICNCGFPLFLGLVADAVEYQEYRTGIRSDGTAYASQGLAIKIGQAVGSAAGMIALAKFGYIANEVQTESTLKGINLTVNLIPAVLFVIAAIALVVLWNKKDDEFNEIRRLLREKANGE